MTIIMFWSLVYRHSSEYRWVVGVLNAITITQSLALTLLCFCQLVYMYISLNINFTACQYVLDARPVWLHVCTFIMCRSHNVGNTATLVGARIRKCVNFGL